VAVKLLIIGQPNDVEVTIALLYPCGFCRVEDWSRPLQFTQIQEAAARQPSEIMRIYKRYLRQVTNFSLKVSGIVTCLFLH
jgi:predicted phosphoribosyltransferase